MPQEPVVGVDPAERRSPSSVVDLGMHPPCRGSCTDEAEAMEPFYPLVTGRVRTAVSCRSATKLSGRHLRGIRVLLVVLRLRVDHVRRYAQDINNASSGSRQSRREVRLQRRYMLQWFVEMGVPGLGIEPARNIAEVAREKGIKHAF